MLSEGNVEVFHAGLWGSVCDDEFDKNEGDVVCRALGFTMGADRVTSNGYFGPGLGTSNAHAACMQCSSICAERMVELEQ